ncbi:2-oxoglutarate-dependent dioxygenase-like protein [Hapsidospora chrysogenum ATCC 11550]|uniref:2-oxoglutarate-dependent dioxygenase-like protein n=1 Tax=Hapsidospora chrysogenum (strain ATCC 11550 / CBS 779.69 / DSM 880 / IAM 14645 / JCM 23072 / IMI 49137) TaxID=857340 RepID=A0A086STW5_HAPC1|nr:2-oxoglutarate-dependent dioxygenase-like protein [Hapsidospora chrysogenum ATCC 11550]
MSPLPKATFTEIPRIDLSLAGDPLTEPTLLAKLRYALIDVGFMYIENHGVPTRVVDDIRTALPELFALPPSAKAAVSISNSPHFLGYSGDGSETTAGQSDRREQFEFANELTATWREGLPLSERLRGPNPWPSEYPKLRPLVESYISEMSDLGERFLRLVAKALSLGEGTFLDFLSDQHRLKLVHYPALPESESGGQGVGPHKDSSGWWTFLLQASPPHVKGLQVLNKAGSWVDVPVIPDTFVVNIGQAFEVVTNGVCKATTHRVLGGPLERFSVPFFQGVRRNLSKDEALNTLKAHFSGPEFHMGSGESEEGRDIDSAFLKGKYDTWGEAQLRTKIRSHRDVGARFYSDVFDKYVNDES